MDDDDAAGALGSLNAWVVRECLSNTACHQISFLILRSVNSASEVHICVLQPPAQKQYGSNIKPQIQMQYTVAAVSGTRVDLGSNYNVLARQQCNNITG